LEDSQAASCPRNFFYQIDAHVSNSPAETILNKWNSAVTGLWNEADLRMLRVTRRSKKSMLQ
jgi:hypothetical protein